MKFFQYIESILGVAKLNIIENLIFELLSQDRDSNQFKSQTLEESIFNSSFGYLPARIINNSKHDME